LDGIFIKGARVHNLKNVTVTIPRNKLVVVTGVSGSGKSSLTIDTLFAKTKALCREPKQLCTPVHAKNE
jgi:excinuclease UvrABC ATPase subunit